MPSSCFQRLYVKSSITSYSLWSQHGRKLKQVSTAPPSPPAPKQSLASPLLEPASWYQTRHIVYIANADMELPTHRKLRPHSQHRSILTKPCAGFLSANLLFCFSFHRVFLWVAEILYVTLLATFSSCRSLHCNMSAEKQVLYSSLMSILTIVIPFVLLSRYCERRKWEKDKQLFGDNRKMPFEFHCSLRCETTVCASKRHTVCVTAIGRISYVLCMFRTNCVGILQTKVFENSDPRPKEQYSNELDISFAM